MDDIRKYNANSLMGTIDQFPLLANAGDTCPMLIEGSFKYLLAHYLTSIQWRPVAVKDCVADIEVEHAVFGTVREHKKIHKYKCRLPLAHIIANIHACRLMHPRFLKNLIRDKLYGEVKSVADHHMCKLKIVSKSWKADDVRLIISNPCLQWMVPYVLPLKKISLRTGIELVMRSGVKNIDDMLAALTYSGPTIRDFNTIVQLADVTKLRPHLDICGYNCRLDLVSCIDTHDSVFERFLSNYICIPQDAGLVSSIDMYWTQIHTQLKTLIQYGWPTSYYLRRRILQLCFKNNISHLIARPLKIVAHCMWNMCAYNKGPPAHDLYACLSVADEIYGDTIHICNVHLKGVSLYDISPMFLQQIMYTDDHVNILPMLGRFQSCSAKHVDAVFTPSDAAKRIIITHTDKLEKLVPLLFPITDDNMLMYVVDQWFLKNIDMDAAMMCACNATDARHSTYQTDLTLLVDTILTYPASYRKVSDDPRIVHEAEIAMPGTHEHECALVRKEEMLLALSPFLPDTSPWKTPFICCVLYEPHFGQLQQCTSKHPVCYTCCVKIRAENNGALVCPCCRFKNDKYDFLLVQ